MCSYVTQIEALCICVCLLISWSVKCFACLLMYLHSVWHKSRTRHNRTQHDARPKAQKRNAELPAGVGWPVVGGKRVGVTFRESARERARGRKGKKSVNAEKETNNWWGGGTPTQLAPIFIYIPPWPLPLLCCTLQRDPHGQLSHRQKCRVAFFNECVDYSTNLWPPSQPSAIFEQQHSPA